MECREKYSPKPLFSFSFPNIRSKKDPSHPWRERQRVDSKVIDCDVGGTLLLWSVSSCVLNHLLEERSVAQFCYLDHPRKELNIHRRYVNERIEFLTATRHLTTAIPKTSRDSGIGNLSQLQNHRPWDSGGRMQKSLQKSQFSPPRMSDGRFLFNLCRGKWINYKCTFISASAVWLLSSFQLE